MSDYILELAEKLVEKEGLCLHDALDLVTEHGISYWNEYFKKGGELNEKTEE